jgi:hypothetical protein
MALPGQTPHNAVRHVGATCTIERIDGIKAPFHPALQILSQPAACPEQPGFDRNRVEFQVAGDLFLRHAFRFAQDEHETQFVGQTVYQLFKDPSKLLAPMHGLGGFRVSTAEQKPATGRRKSRPLSCALEPAGRA